MRAFISAGAACRARREPGPQKTQKTRKTRKSRRATYIRDVYATRRYAAYGPANPTHVPCLPASALAHAPKHALAHTCPFQCFGVVRAGLVRRGVARCVLWISYRLQPWGLTRQ
jgi:hypothetical protein